MQMEKITTVAELKSAIQQLEYKQAGEWPLLKEQFISAYQSFKPVNLIKNTLHELVTAPDLKGDLLNTSLSLAAGYLTKKIVVGTTQNPLKQLFGTLLQMGVTSIASKNAEVIKSGINKLITNIFLAGNSSKTKEDTPASPNI